MTAAARDAVATARGYSAIQLVPTELAPCPVVHGEWTTPIQGDPFLIPFSDQWDLIRSYTDIADRVTPQSLVEGDVLMTFNWTKEYRLYASTDGSLVTQTLYRSHPAFGWDDFPVRDKRGYGPTFRRRQIFWPRCRSWGWWI